MNFVDRFFYNKQKSLIETMKKWKNNMDVK